MCPCLFLKMRKNCPHGLGQGCTAAEARAENVPCCGPGFRCKELAQGSGRDWRVIINLVIATAFPMGGSSPQSWDRWCSWEPAVSQQARPPARKDCICHQLQKPQGEGFGEAETL